MNEWVGDGQVNETRIRNNQGDLRGSCTGAWQTELREGLAKGPSNATCLPDADSTCSENTPKVSVG